LDQEKALRLEPEATPAVADQGPPLSAYRSFILAAAVVGLFVISPMAFHLPVDRVLWQYASWRLAQEPVAQVIVEQAGDSPARVLAGPAASRAATAFCQGDFCQSTRSGYEPECAASVVLAFESGRTVRANMWPDGRFAVAEYGGRFLLDAPALRRLVEEQGLSRQ
jgi:hypothetical protein